MACSLIGFLLSDGPGPISTVYQLLVGQPELHSLEQALKVASQLKERGDEALNVNDTHLKSIRLYVEAITKLLPWFPSDYYMAPWEARLSGVGGLIVKCNINLAIAVFKSPKFRMEDTSYRILESTAQLTCVTNWEMAKILHLQGRISQDHRERLCKHQKPYLVDRKLASEGMSPSSLLFTQSAKYLRRPRGQLANQPWVGDFSPRHFASHYEALKKRLPGKASGREERWYHRGDSAGAIHMASWLGRMEKLQEEWGVQMVAAYEDDDDELAADNRRMGATSGEV